MTGEEVGVSTSSSPSLHTHTSSAIANGAGSIQNIWTCSGDKIMTPNQNSPMSQVKKNTSELKS
jgi:hypothetical protein